MEGEGSVVGLTYMYIMIRIAMGGGKVRYGEEGR